MLELFRQPWPWYISGAAIAFIMVMLLFFGKSFGFSANLRTICAIAVTRKKPDFFNWDWRTRKWNLLFLLGSVMGGAVSSAFLKNDEPLELSAATINDLKNLGIVFDGALNPSQLFGPEFLSSARGIIVLLFGGLLVGFGSAYAGGCTSGHAISGLSNLQLPSLVAAVGFFIGGLVMTHLLFPLIF